MRAYWTGHSTHLQDGVFREVCAVDGVFHFVFAVKRSQRVGPQMPRDFLSWGGEERTRKLINLIRTGQEHHPK